MSVSPETFILGILFIVLAYFVGVKKQMWLLSGYNQHRVRDKEKLSQVVGIGNLIAGLFLIAISVLAPSKTVSALAIPLAVLAHLIILVYVQVKMVVDK